MPVRAPERYYTSAAQNQAEKRVTTWQKFLLGEETRSKQTYRALAEKPRIDEHAMNFIRRTDHGFAKLVWKSLYDAHLGKHGDHQAAVAHADKEITRVAAAGRAEQLPDMFRGGELSQILTQFQNETNQNLNFWYL